MQMCPFLIHISYAALVHWHYKLYIQSTELLVPCGEDGFYYAPMNIAKRKVFTSFKTEEKSMGVLQISLFRYRLLLHFSTIHHMCRMCEYVHLSTRNQQRTFIVQNLQNLTHRWNNTLSRGPVCNLKSTFAICLNTERRRSEVKTLLQQTILIQLQLNSRNISRLLLFFIKIF